MDQRCGYMLCSVVFVVGYRTFEVVKGGGCGNIRICALYDQHSTYTPCNLESYHVCDAQARVANGSEKSA